MKKLIHITLAFLFATTAFATEKEAKLSKTQGKKFERRKLRADRSFDSYLYAKAVKQYGKVLNIQSTPETQLQIAESYRLMNKPKKAHQWYSKIEDQETVFEVETYRNYAQVLAAVSKYDEANLMYKIYDQKTNRRESNINRKINGLTKINSFMRDSAAYSVQNAFVNSSEKDFSPTYYKDGFVFVSSRSNSASELLKPKYGWDQSLFLDLYYVAENGKKQVEKFEKGINTRYHEGPSVFYENGEKIIFTRNNFTEGKASQSSDGVTKLKMFSANKKANGKWGKPVAFPYNSDEYSVGHPTITPDGQTLYFASDMPGGHGKGDIYRSTLENEQWSTPINLGPRINTPEDELFPFYQDELIYFASNGHPGLGSLDIFKSQLEDADQVVINMGAPVNSNRDDFGLVLSEEGKLGYLSSNREGGLGEDDIYDLVIFDYIIKVDLIDKETGELLNGTMELVDTYDKAGLQLLEDEHHMEFKGLNGRTFKVTGSSTEYRTDSLIIATGEESLDNRELYFKLPLERSRQPIDVLIVENNGNRTQLFTMLDTPEEYEGTKEDIEESYILRDTTIVKNIYYDFDKYNVREDAQVELDHLLEVLGANQSLSLELASHTDSRGTNNYNDVLADNRSKSAMNYLLENGLDKDRVTIASYGENALLNKCGDSINCDENSHQNNRRTEIRLKSI